MPIDIKIVHGRFCTVFPMRQPKRDEQTFFQRVRGHVSQSAEVVEMAYNGTPNLISEAARGAKDQSE